MRVGLYALRRGEGARLSRAFARLSFCVACLVAAAASSPARAQESVSPDEAEFGPVVRAYLGYLRAEQVVTDDRASRREVSPAYVRRNSNRVRALRATAIRIARETKNDYLPELYAVARDELGTLFETPPRPESFRAGEVINNTFRFLGPQRTGELFYVFARLDIYEQAELLKNSGENRDGAQARPHAAPASPPQPTAAPTSAEAATRPRRVAPGETQGSPPPAPGADKP